MAQKDFALLICEHVLVTRQTNNENIKRKHFYLGFVSKFMPSNLLAVQCLYYYFFLRYVAVSCFLELPHKFLLFLL